MRFLIDANLPIALCKFLSKSGYETLYVRDLPNGDYLKDEEIIKMASNDDFILVTKDSDYLFSYILQNKPPKLIKVETGNISNFELLQIFEKVLPYLLSIHKDKFCVTLDRNFVFEI